MSARIIGAKPSQYSVSPYLPTRVGGSIPPTSTDIGDLVVEILEPDTLAATQALASRLNAPTEPGVVLQAILKPLVLGIEAYEDAGSLTVPRNDDVFLLRQAEIPGEVVLHSG